MRKEKLEELNQLLDYYKVLKRMKTDDPEKPFMWTETYNNYLQDGSVLTFQKLVTRYGNGDATAVLPITENGEIVFIVQPRPNTKEGVCIEIPAGYRELDESDISVGIRELEEETGLICKPSNMHFVTEYNQDTGKSAAKIAVYIATDCIDTNLQHLDKDERIKLYRCSIEEGFELLNLGRLHGASTLLALSMGKSLIKKRGN